MECRKCGLVLGPFDDKCPRCGQLASAQGEAPAAPGAPAGRAPMQPAAAAGAGPAAPYPAVPPRRRSLAGPLAAVLALLFVLLGAAGIVVIGRMAPRSGLQLVQGLQAGSILRTPAVTTAQIGRRLADAGAAAGGELEVSLAWNALSDLDLEVRNPSGELISAREPRARSGGVQDVDANPTLVTAEGARRCDAGQNPGPENVMPLPEVLVDLDKTLSSLPKEVTDALMAQGSEGKAPSRFTRTPVEHVYFAQIPKGTYTVYAHCYSWREKDRNPLPYTIEVRRHGKVFHQVSGTLGPRNYITDNTSPTLVCQFVMR